MLKSLEVLESLGEHHCSLMQKYECEKCEMPCNKCKYMQEEEIIKKDLEVLDIILRCPFIIDSLQQLSKLPAQAKHRYTYGTITVRETEKVEEFFKNGESK